MISFFSSSASSWLSQVKNIPNILTLSRLALIPIFVMSMVNHHYTVSLIEIMYMSITDFLDGKIARKFHQITQLGTYLDPLADRLFMIIVPLTMCYTHIIPIIFIIIIIIRDGAIFLLGLILRKKNLLALPVIMLGKLATFSLMLGFTLILLSKCVPATSWCFTLSYFSGNAVIIWGLALYVYTLGIYWWQSWKIPSFINC